MRHFALPILAAAAFTVAACTPQEESAALAGVSTACSLAAVGTTVFVDVASAGAASLATAQLAQTVTGAACPVLVSQAQAAVTSLNNAGQTAQVTVLTAAPKSARRVVRAKMAVRRDASGQTRMTYIVRPDFVLPLVGAL